jgi:phosphatidylinositol alpha-1,6-mannosyltransferase
MTDAVMVTSSFLPGRGGIESYLAELCTLVSPRVAVLAPPERDGVALPTDLPYPTAPGPGSMLVPNDKVARAIVEQARLHRTDRVLFGTPWPLVLLGPRLKAAGLRYAVIVHGAELIVPGALPLLRARIARALGTADLLLPVSDYTADATASLLERQHVAVPRMERLRARVDTSLFRPDLEASQVRRRLGIAPEQKIVLCFGRLVPRKGVDRLIRAMPEIERSVPGVTLVIGGTGPEERRLQRLAARERARVVFAGRVPDDEAPPLYSTADVFALPVVDRWFGLEIEGLGVVLLEASACETPCVSGRSGGTPEAVLDGETGYVIDARSRELLVERVVRLLADDPGRAAMGAAARHHVETHFSAALPPTPLLEWLG